MQVCSITVLAGSSAHWGFQNGDVFCKHMDQYIPFIDCEREASSTQNHVDAAQVTQESLFLTLTQGDTFAAAFANFLAGVLGVDVSLVEVNDLVLQPGTSITSTSQASIAIRVDSLITPADSFSAEQVSLFSTFLLCTW